ncbi:conserved hypothetical protein [Histoplasma capsulatum H143]|uniref:Myb-like domain-containing protein n=1 Tax=Ajellomyces capsulatus (strain H143) TaxID=544712 RepID=C6HCN1_AJECH|nr:conserved hypothetical protein [Histoplasma capsulatum H143]
MASGNDQAETGEASGGGNRSHPRGARWTEEEEMWLIVNTIDQHSNEWLAQNIPGGNGRTSNSIASHLAELRTKGKLPRGWRWANINGAPDWTIEEDLEIIEWILHGKRRIDAQVFVAADRSGEAIKRRAGFLMADDEFVATVYAVDESVRLAQLQYDMALEGPEKQAAYAVLVNAENNSEQIIREALQKTLDRSVYEAFRW